MKFIILFVSILITYSQKTQYFHFLRKHTIYSDLNNLFQSNIIEPVILNGIKTSYKKTLCVSFCLTNNISFKEYSLNKFIKDVPHLKYENAIIYINDFLVGNGRVFNNYEENLLLSLKKTTNLIVFESENIEHIPIKNNNIINNFKILQFPILNKLDLIHYIYDVIYYQKYNDELFLLNWNQYDLDNLNFEKINILLFELDDMLNNEIEFKKIHNRVNNIIESFKY